MSFDEVAASVITRFVKDDEIPELALRDIIMRSFEGFRAPGKPIALPPKYLERLCLIVVITWSRA